MATFTSFRFLDLPPELRIMVYKAAFSGFIQGKGGLCHPFAMVSKQVRDECIPYIVQRMFLVVGNKRNRESWECMVYYANTRHRIATWSGLRGKPILRYLKHFEKIYLGELLQNRAPRLVFHIRFKPRFQIEYTSWSSPIDEETVKLLDQKLNSWMTKEMPTHIPVDWIKKFCQYMDTTVPELPLLGA